MNRKFGIYTSLATGTCVLLFLIGMLTANDTLNYFVCLLLSWAYVCMACAFAHYAAPQRKAIAYAGMAIGVLYSVFVSLVYFTQLTTVAHQAADPGILSIFTFAPGSWAFGLDLLGYGLMALSTFFLGLTLQPVHTRDKALKILLLLHGVFFPACVLLPMFNVFQPGAGDSIGSYALIFWCVYFLPVTALSLLHFRAKQQEV